MFIRIHDKTANLKAMAVHDLRTAQQRPDSKQQLIKIDRFCHVIIDPDPVALLHGPDIVLCSHEQDRDLAVQTADCFRELIPINPRHHDIGDNEVKNIFIHRIIGILCIQTPDRFISVPIQKSAYGAVQIFVIFYYK